MTDAALIFIGVLLALFCVVLFGVMLCLRQKIPQNSVIDDSRYLLVYASQSGQTEAYAQQTAQQLQQQHVSLILLDIQDLSVEILQQAKHVIWMVSTYGEADAPDRAQAFTRLLFKHPIDLSQQSFAFLAFGDQRYQEFCGFGRRLYERLLELQAQPYFDLVQVDQQSSESLSHWNSQLAKVTGYHTGLTTQEKHWTSLILTSRELLNAGSQGTGLYHLKFSLPAEMTWKSGDILELQCANSAAALLQFQQVHPELNRQQLNLLKHKDLRQIDSSTRLSIASIEALKDLPLREYSIASVVEQGSLELLVRQEVYEDGLGLGSGLLTEWLEIGQSIQAHIRCNPSFHLLDEAHPAIFIANGSGLAGVMAHLQQLALNGQHENWLIYGERQQQFDAICTEQLQAWQQQSHLIACDLVYSRDAAECRYVQDLLLQQSKQIQSWIERGAVIYLCGSLKGMAQGVDRALLTILGKEQLNRLKAEQRYRRDVY